MDSSPTAASANAATALDDSWSAVRTNRMGDLLLFFFLAYALMWTCFITVAAQGISPASLLGGSLILLGAISPSISALIVTARAEGKSGVAALLRRVVKWQVPARFYVFALAFTVVVKLTVALIVRLAAGAWPRFGTESLVLIPFAILVSTPVQAGEEIGWRGYALPRLAARFGLAGASIILGVIWALWHLPQFFIRGADTYHQSFVAFSLGVVALSVILAWLYWRTNGSLLLTMLLHAAFNNSKDVVPAASLAPRGVFSAHASLVAWLTTLVIWICAAYFLARMPKKNALPSS